MVELREATAAVLRSFPHYFTSEAHIAQCEKAIGVLTGPRSSLADLKNNSAYVLDATKYCAATGQNQVEEAASSSSCLTVPSSECNLKEDFLPYLQ